MKLTLDNKPGSAHDADIPPKYDSKENKNFCWVFTYQVLNKVENVKHCTGTKFLSSITGFVPQVSPWYWPLRVKYQWQQLPILVACSEAVGV